MAQIAVVGTGYVGLTTGACLAHLGHTVVCVDIDADKVARLSRGEIPIHEHRLDEMVAEGLVNGRLIFVVDAVAAVATAEFVFLCVPTPQDDDGSADLSYVEAAAVEISEALPFECVVVTKSTVPVGSSMVVERALRRPDVTVVSNPEFLREGSAVDDFLHPDRIVVGCHDLVVARKVGGLYEHLHAQLVLTDPASAELIKYASNAFLATKLSFANAIAAISEGVGADVHDVMVGLGYDHRIGPEFLRPGPGWGGSCFPKDTRALQHIARAAGYEFDLLRSVVSANDAQFDRIVDKVRLAVGGSLDGIEVAVWGLTFKARTDDLRDSPSIAIITRLLAAGARVTAHDPTVPAHRPGVPDSVRVEPDPLAACRGAAVLVVLTEWDDYRWIDPSEVAAVMPGRTVVDARNLLDPSGWHAATFAHRGVGR